MHTILKEPEVPLNLHGENSLLNRIEEIVLANNEKQAEPHFTKEQNLLQPL
jgi:hypothetical protein